MINGEKIKEIFKKLRKTEILRKSILCNYLTTLSILNLPEVNIFDF